MRVDAPKGVTGAMEVLALRDGAFVLHVRAFFGAEEADALLAVLLAELEWTQRTVVLFGREVVQPRLIAWAGALPYRYSGRTLEPRRMGATLAAMVSRVSARAQAPFNHVLANRYRDGDDSMGMHADDEPELGAEPVVASLSLGAARAFVLAARHGPERHRLLLGHGVLCVMGGTCQRHYRHGVPKTRAPVGERVSLTLRQVLPAPGPNVTPRRPGGCAALR